MAHEMVTVVPDSMRQLRACLNCSLIKTTAQFKSGGCENCHPRPQKAGADGRPDPNYRKKELDNDMEQYTLRHTTTEFNGYATTSARVSLSCDTWLTSNVGQQYDCQDGLEWQLGGTLAIDRTYDGVYHASRTLAIDDGWMDGCVMNRICARPLRRQCITATRRDRGGRGARRGPGRPARACR